MVYIEVLYSMVKPSSLKSTECSSIELKATKHITMASLHWVDYLIFAAFMLASIGIGIYHSLTGGKQKTTQEFIMADRQLKVLPTMMSLVASYYSAILILGCTAEFYNWGVQIWLLKSISSVLGLTLAERFIVPWLYALKLTSAFEVR